MRGPLVLPLTSLLSLVVGEVVETQLVLVRLLAEAMAVAVLEDTEN
jgi:hypothetical protein